MVKITIEISNDLNSDEKQKECKQTHDIPIQPLHVASDSLLRNSTHKSEHPQQSTQKTRKSNAINSTF